MSSALPTREPGTAMRSGGVVVSWKRELSDSGVLAAAAQEFYERQVDRLAGLGIDAGGFSLSHVAVRAPTWRDYLETRHGLEAAATANFENVWNGRPISKIVLAEPLMLGERAVDLVELIPPFHQRVYAMGLEHLGFVVGDLQSFVDQHMDVLTGMQFQSRTCTPAYVMFPDYTHVKFYARSLRDECEKEGAVFSGFRHAPWSTADDLAGPYEVL
ncbi:VOC family protein [Streptomyces sp. NPDC057675]|uniref:VOC family protein n=1 Tax=Streptomyces sp. NPDC057675 TaxID=3346204 RepID=UPI00367B3ED3